MNEKPMMHVGARLDKSDHRKLKQVVKELKLTTSEFVRIIINEKINKQNERSDK